MRRWLNALYDAAAVGAAIMMVGTLAMVLLGMLDRYLALGVRGTDLYAGYAMAGAGFLALAQTLRRGEHIRVTLILQRLRGTPQRALEFWCLGAGVLLAGLFCFFSIRLAYQSWDFHDISTGNDATPLWIPQLSMALGTLVLCIALVDQLVSALRGGALGENESDAALHNE